MSTHLTETTAAEMKKNAERQKAKEYKGSLAEPRTFYKTSIYTGEELKRRWRSTMWDNVPSLMGSQRIPRRA